MSKLPARLQPLWPLAKRVHRALSFVLGVLGRRLAPLLGERGLPRSGSTTSAATAAAEPDAVTLHGPLPAPPVEREVPPGSPPRHWTFTATTRPDVPPVQTLEVRGGTVVGEFAAVITPGRVLDFETSDYWGIAGWQEHPMFLRPRLPEIEHVSGTVAVLATRGGNASYYHYLLDVLPRLEVLRRTLPDVAVDHYYLERSTRYHREILALAGLDQLPRLEVGPERAVRADRLLVPSIPNLGEHTPPWIVDHVRSLLPPAETADKPTRLYVTRGDRPHTRRMESEAELWPLLEARGFARVDPGSMSVRDQVDTFAAADVIVGVHGAALTNLLFCRPGVRVLHLMAPTYVKHCFYAILDAIPDARYRYLIGDGRTPPEGSELTGVQDDIDLAPEKVLAELDVLLAE